MSREEAGRELLGTAETLALALIGRSSHCGGTICSECHMGSLGRGDELNHVPSCRVGRVLEAARRFRAAENELEQEFLRAEGHKS